MTLPHDDPLMLTMHGFAVRALEIALAALFVRGQFPRPIRAGVGRRRTDASFEPLARPKGPYRQIPDRSLAPGTGEGASGAGERLEIWRYGLAIDLSGLSNVSQLWTYR